MFLKQHYSGLFMLLFSLAALSACISKSNPYQAGNLHCRPGQPNCNLILGYPGNQIAPGVIGATIAGGGQNGVPNQVTGNYGVVTGGEGNIAGELSTVGGGYGNAATHFDATVSGGANNLADGEEAAVGGGLKNVAKGRFSTVSGGSTDIASDDNATVSGGSGNQATNQFATVGGGTLNLAESLAATVSGGDHNQAKGSNSAIAGGVNNRAQGDSAAIGGGAGNVAGGAFSTIPGGFANQANGDYSFAAGRTAEISNSHPGSFLFSDASPFPFLSLAPDEFAVRATGGVRFTTALDATGKPLAGVRLSPGSGAWESLSDGNAKAGFSLVDGNQVLEKLMSVPISNWYYRGEGPATQHMGPTAQDFHAAFGLGRDDKYISTVDEEGIALASLQALYRLVQKNMAAGTTSAPIDSRIASLERQLAFSNGLAVLALLVAVVALCWRGGRIHLDISPRSKKGLQDN